MADKSNIIPMETLNSETGNKVPCDATNHRKRSLETMEVWPQILLTVIASLAHFSLGTVLAYPSISTPELSVPLPDPTHTKTEYKFPNTSTSLDLLNYTLVPEYSSSDHPNYTSSSSWDEYLPQISLSSSQIGWFVSFHLVGAIVGSVISGPIMSALGQRKTILITCPINFISWLTVWAAPSFPLLMIARLCLGICVSISTVASQVYVVETAHESIRGSLSCLTDTVVGIGLLFTYALGVSGLGWRWTAFTLSLVTTFPLAVGISMFPDSPRWLTAKGRTESARKSLQFLRGYKHDVSTELDSIIRVKPSGFMLREQVLSLSNSEVYTPFFTVIGLFFLMQFSGPYVVYSYTVFLFQASEISLSPYLSTVLVGVSRVIGSFVGIVVVERAGRRPAMMAGSLGTFVSLVCLAAYFFFLESEASSFGWLALGSVLSYTAIVGATISPICFLLSSELLPLSFRSLGSSITKIVFFLGGMLTTSSLPVLKEAFGWHAVLGFYALSALLLFLLVFWMLPETKGRTLEEIEEYYKDRTSRPIN